MGRRIVPLGGAAVLAALGVASGAALAVRTLPAVGAGDAGLSACTAAPGVLVAVDFSHWGGSVDLGCAPGRQANGLEAMHDAGFITSGDEADGDAFVCRIGLATKGVASERPTPSEDPCVSTPPASAYWAFWVADAGQGSWSYSQAGAASYRPPRGSIEGWAFGSGGPPSVTPAQLRAETAAPTTTVPTTTAAPSTEVTVSTAAPTTTAPAPTSSLTTTGSTRPTTTTSPPPTAPGAGPSTTPSTMTAVTGATSHSRIVAIGSGAGSHPPGGPAGSSTGVIVGAAIVAVLAAAGGTFAWRRRRAA